MGKAKIARAPILVASFRKTGQRLATTSRGSARSDTSTGVPAAAESTQGPSPRVSLQAFDHGSDLVGGVQRLPGAPSPSTMDTPAPSMPMARQQDRSRPSSSGAEVSDHRWLPAEVIEHGSVRTAAPRSTSHEANFSFSRSLRPLQAAGPTRVPAVRGREPQPPLWSLCAAITRNPSSCCRWSRLPNSTAGWGCHQRKVPRWKRARHGRVHAWWVWFARAKYCRRSGSK